MDDGNQPALSRRARRALPLIAVALTLIVVTSLLYLRANAPRPEPVYVPPPPVAILSGDFDATFDFVTPSLGWSVVVQTGQDVAAFTVFKTTDGAKHWQRQLNDTTQYGPMSLEFFDSKDGIVFASYGLASYFSTRDGGAHWRQVDLQPGSQALVFGDVLHAWDVLSPGQSCCLLQATSDGGATWMDRAWPSGAALDSRPGLSPFAVRPGGEAWLGTMGPQASVMRSQDGGATWTSVSLPIQRLTPPSPVPGIKQPPPEAYDFHTDVVALPGSGVLVMADDFLNDPTVAYESFDLGQTWRQVMAPPQPAIFADVSFQDRNHWWAFKFGFLFKTSDAGRSWQETKVQPLLENWTYGRVNVIDAKHAWVAMTAPVPPGRGPHQTSLSMTSDGGASWHAVNVPASV